MNKNSDNLDRMEIKIHPNLYCSLVRIYDRYVEVTGYDKNTTSISFTNFVNQLLIKGMFFYNKPLTKCEETLEKGARK